MARDGRRARELARRQAAGRSLGRVDAGADQLTAGEVPISWEMRAAGEPGLCATARPLRRQ